jgi:hypothetical protein
MVAGWQTRDSTPPRLSAKQNNENDEISFNVFFKDKLNS